MDHWLINLLAPTPTGETTQHLYDAAAVMTGRNQVVEMLGTLCSFEGYGMRGFRVRRLALDPGLSVNHRARPRWGDVLAGAGRPAPIPENSIASASIVSASCKGHPVDALALEADEGRCRLR